MESFVLMVHQLNHQTGNFILYYLTTPYNPIMGLLKQPLKESLHILSKPYLPKLINLWSLWMLT